jgi:uncharacterized membrane protein YhaH (DUF805 family)
MDLQWLLFSFSGRINRAKYWLALLVSIIAVIVAMIVAHIFSALLGKDAGWLVMLAAFIAAGGVSIWITVATGVKRLHDREKSGWWLLLFYVVPGTLDGIGRVTPDTVSFILSLVAFAVSIWGFVELGCLKGTTGSNAYGPAPIPITVTA